MQLLPRLFVRKREFLGGHPHKRSQASRRSKRARGRLFERAQEPQPVVGCGRRKDALHPRYNHRDTDCAQRRLHDRRLAVGPYQDPYVPRPDGPAPPLALRPSLYQGRSRLKQPHHVCREVLSNKPLDQPPANSFEADLPPGHETGPQWRRDRRAFQARLLMSLRGMGRPVLDLAVAQVERLEQGVVSSEKSRVGAPVLFKGEALLWLGLPRGLEVRVDISSTERVNSLLRVADQHEPGYTVCKGRLDHLPLDGVGVLELVDEHHSVPFAQPAASHLASLFVRQSGKEAIEEAVVGQEIGVEQALL